jgi:hypothetical protein
VKEFGTAATDVAVIRAHSPATPALAPTARNKKSRRADSARRLFRRVGLLINKPPGVAELPFI